MFIRGNNVVPFPHIGRRMYKSCHFTDVPCEHVPFGIWTETRYEGCVFLVTAQQVHNVEKTSY